jgi:clan AA aspartic protease
MIVGVVQRREAIVRLTVRGSHGRVQEIDAVVDTGFTGWLTLPPALVVALDLNWLTAGRGVLADGSRSAFDVFQGNVVWNGRIRRVAVVEVDGCPLIGMALLQGHELRVQARSRGKVTIKRLPKR